MKRQGQTIPVSEIMSALADPVRVRLLRLLEREELSVGEVGAVLQMPQSTVSRQLKVLSETGWLIRRADGPATMYRLLLDDLPPAASAVWVAIRDHMGEGSELREDLRRLASVLADRMTDSQSFFGRVAGAWDEVRNDLFGVGFTARALLGLLNPSWTIIDAGCGTGNASELLAPHVKRVIAVDDSASMLSAAKKRLSSLKNVEFVRGRLDAMPIEDATADALVCVLVLHHIADPAPALREMRRVVRPGGRVLVVDMLAHDREEYRRSMGHKHLGFAESEAGAMLERAGLVSVRVTPLPGEPNAKGPSMYVAVGLAPPAKNSPDRKARER